MSRWGNLFGGSGSAEQLPDSIAGSKRGLDSAFEVFIDGALTKIYNEASGRAKEQRAVREACKQVLDTLRAEDGHVSTPLDKKLANAVLDPLRLACSLDVARVMEPALGCLHKLVAHAYLQAESTSAGRLDDGSITSQVVQLVSKCGENGGESIQLAVIRALLTITTAEHFVVHGDCLMQAVRTVFNVAIGSDSADIQRTARNALLQMLNTIVKHITQYPLSRRSSSISGDKLDRMSLQEGADPAAAAMPSVSEDQEQEQAAQAADHAGSGTEHAEDAAGAPDEAPADASNNMAGAETGEGEADAMARSGGAAQEREPAGVTSISGRETTTADSELPSMTPSLSPLPSRNTTAADETAAEGSSEAQADGEPSQSEDQNGVADPQLHAEPSQEAAGDGGSAGPSAEAQQGEAVEVAMANTRTAQLASLAEQADLRGLEKALDQMEAERSGADVAKAKAGGEDKERDVRRVLMRERRANAWRHLNVLERDVLTVLAAICKMAARETGFGAVEQYMHAGKLLALELLVRVLDSPQQTWVNVRSEFCEQLRQPLCLALLRNCMSPFDEAFAAATRLFNATLLQAKLRNGLKAELGAFYPLLLLRPLETDRTDSAQLAAALEALQALCSQAQIMVDLFVNYDCDLQAANLFERTLRGLSRTIRRSDPNPLFATPQSAKAKVAALKAVLSLLHSLEAWAQPIQNASEAAAAANGVDQADAAPENTASLTHAGSAASLASPASADEVARFNAIKEKKHSLEAGIALFNRDSLKGLASLIGSGTVGNSPEAIARFLRDNAAGLDKAQLGELFGHHEPLQISTMHAYIDMERFEGQALDSALRTLLKGFKLPGEAQKIDRIMEKFAERYCKDNPAAFRTADAAYLLAFALIMLNTDAHNPMADKKLSAADFVGMCQVQAEDGAFEAILSEAELEEMYARIVTQEILVPESPVTKTRRAVERTKSQSVRLAAALGLTQLMMPFRAGPVWDKQHGVDIERKRLLDHTRLLVAKGMAAGNLWHTATHAEHARPMFQVSGDAVLKGLHGFACAPDAAVAAPILEGFRVAIRLAGVLGLDALCEAFVATLAELAAVTAPAIAPGNEEAKQVAALKALVDLAVGPEASLLGSGWVVVMRTLSNLEALQVQLMQRASEKLQASIAANPTAARLVQASMASAHSSSMTDSPATTPVAPTFTGNPHGSFGMAPSSPVGISGAPVFPAVPSASPVQSGSAIGRLFTRIGLAPAEPAGPVDERVSGAVAALEETTQEHLHPAVATPPPAGEPAKPSRLRRLDSQAAANSVISQAIAREGPGAGLVLWAEGPGSAAIEEVYARSATLNGDAVVIFMRALCAVSQEELVPSRPEDKPRVYSLQKLIECAYHNLGRIRLIWGRLWAALAAHLVSAACHPDPEVAYFAVDSLRQLVAKLLIRAELTNFTQQDEALRPFVAVLRHCDALAVRVLTVQCIAQAISAHPRGLGSGWRSVLEALTVAAADHNPAVVDGALDAIRPVVEALYRGLGVGHEYFADCVTMVSTAMRNPIDEDLSIGAGYILQSLARRLAASSPQDWKLRRNKSLRVSRQTGDPALDGSRSPDTPHTPKEPSNPLADHPWAQLLSAFAMVARHDPRPRVANECAHCMLEVLEGYSQAWDAAIWQVAHKAGIAYLLELPFPPTAGSGAPKVVGWSVEGMARVHRHAAAHLPAIFSLVVAHYAVAGSVLLQQLLSLLVRYIMQSDEGMAVLGVQLLQQLVETLAARLDAAGWQVVLKSLSMAASADHLQSLINPAARVIKTEATSALVEPDLALLAYVPTAPGLTPADAVRCRCRITLLMQRTLDHIHRSCAPFMPFSAQLQLLAILQDTVQRAASFNRNPSRRSAANKLLQMGDASLSHLAATSPRKPLSQLDQNARPPATSSTAAAAQDAGVQRLGAIAEAPESGSANGAALPHEAKANGHVERRESGAGEAAEQDAVAASAIHALTTISEDVEVDRQPAGSTEADRLQAAVLPGSFDAEVLQPALMRQEAEGGVLLIAALIRCMQPGTPAAAEASGSGAPTHAAPEDEAERRLSNLCRRLVVDAARDAWQHHETAIRGQEGGLAGDGSKALTPEGYSWDQAIRAPLIVSMLSGYREMRSESLKREVRDIFPHLARLVCSAQPSVRAELASLFQSQLPPLLGVV
ncbi:hypothetical protein WJX72_003264 [[Myrmecia] bisecta]|uniref:SEC7 domain-containing protein n=1 Tax=[Myrmecia] bisecta TaxID=41462 RepID=A0AAW1P8S4_9CHLO